MGTGEEFLRGSYSILGSKGPMGVIKSSLLLTRNRAFANAKTIKISDSRCSRRGQSYVECTHEPQPSPVCKDTSTPVRESSRTTKTLCKELYMRKNEINTLKSACFSELRLKL